MKGSILKIICLALSMLLMVTIGVIDRLQKLEESSERVVAQVYSDGSTNVFKTLNLTPYKSGSKAQVSTSYSNSIDYDSHSSLLSFTPIVSSAEKHEKEVYSVGYSGYSSFNLTSKQAYNQSEVANAMVWSVRIHKETLAQNIKPFGYVMGANNLWEQPQSAPMDGGGLVSPDDDDDDLGNPLPVPSGLLFLFVLGLGYAVIRKF